MSGAAERWRHLAAAIEAVLDDPGVSEHRFEHARAGSHPLDEAITMFVTGDVLIHTWDLARSTGFDERLDPDLVAEQLAGMEPVADSLAASGHYAPPVPVPDRADPQTRLLALTGRRA